MLGLLLWDAGRLPAATLRTDLIALLKEWQTLIAGLLAIAGAALVLVAARWQIAGERRLAAEHARQRVHAARMSLASRLEALARQCDNIIWDIALWHSTDGQNGNRHLAVPTPSFATDYAALAEIPAEESEALTRLVMDMASTNDHAMFTDESAGTDVAEEFINVQAAVFALRAIEWNGRMAREIGWKPMHFDPARKTKLERIRDEDLRRHEAELADE